MKTNHSMAMSCKILLPLLLAALTVFLEGCLSSRPPLRVFILSPVEVAVPEGGCPALAVKSVQMPPYLRRLEMVERDGLELRFVDSLQWGQFPDEAIRDVLNAEFQAMAGDDSRPVDELSLVVSHFERLPGGQKVCLAGTYSSRDGRVKGRFDMERAVDGGEPKDVVAGFNAMIGDLAVQLAVGMKQGRLP